MSVATGIIADSYNKPSGGGSSFSPMDMNWKGLWWAEGTKMKALGYTNGALVTAWPDEVGTADTTQATPASQPSYATSVANLNNKPAVDPGAVGRLLASTNNVGQNMPYSLVMITILETGAAGDRYVCANSGGAAARQGSGTITFGVSSPAGQWSTEAAHLYIGFALTIGGSGETVPWLDGTARAIGSGFPAATGTMSLLNRNGGGRSYVRPVSLIGVHIGDIRSHIKWLDFCAWANSYYGVVIAGLFTPTDITSLMLWLDASDPASFTYSSSTVVSQWSDKSGKGKHFTQGTVANQPSRSGTQNGKSTVVFDGTNDSLSCSSPVSTRTADFTMFVACKRTGGDNTNSVVFHNGNPAANGIGLAMREQGNINLGWLNGGIAWTSSSIAETGIPYVVTLTRTTTDTSLFSGIVFGGSNTTAPNIPATSATIVSPSHLWGGEVYEILYYDATLTGWEKETVIAYLQNKWGVP